MAYRDRMAYLSNRLGVPSCDVRRNPLVLSRSLRLEGPFSLASLESRFSIDFQQCGRREIQFTGDLGKIQSELERPRTQAAHFGGRNAERN